MKNPVKFLQLILLLCTSIFLTACFDVNKPSSSNPPGTPPPVNNIAPTISGTPQKNLNTGQSYSFTPTATDPNNDPLVFSVSNLPVWAQFNSQTGQISGTPGSTQAGTYNNILISVSDGKTTTSFSFNLTVTSNNTLANATISWNMPTSYSDGSPFAITDIGGYRLYHGTSQDNMVIVADLNNSSLLTYTFTNLTSGAHYFSVSTYNQSGIESSLSAPININI